MLLLDQDIYGLLRNTSYSLEVPAYLAHLELASGEHECEGKVMVGFLKHPHAHVLIKEHNDVLAREIVDEDVYGNGNEIPAFLPEKDLSDCVED